MIWWVLTFLVVGLFLFFITMMLINKIQLNKLRRKYEKGKDAGSGTGTSTDGDVGTSIITEREPTVEGNAILEGRGVLPLPTNINNDKNIVGDRRNGTGNKKLRNRIKKRFRRK
jgi:hypothetical protein